MKKIVFNTLLVTNCVFACCVALKKNIVFIIVDDLRPALNCYNDKNAFTPNIDKLAQNSIQFNQAYAQQALCAPSRNSFLTSRRPDSLYLYDFYSYWRLAAGNFTTLPQHFKQHGYTTASFGKVFHPGISSNWSDDSPYSWSIEPFHPSTEKYKDSPVCIDSTGRLRSNLVCPVEPLFQPKGTLPDIETVQAAKMFLKNYNTSKDHPFFVAIGFQKPHIPIKFPRKYLKYHPLEKISKPSPADQPPTMPSVAWNPWYDVRKRDDVIALNISAPYGHMPAHFTQIIRQSYYAAVTYIDDLIGQLIDTMENLKLMKNTIIILIGDHGWSLGEHAEWAKYSIFDVAVRVPFILYDPELTTVETRNLSNSLVSDHFVELVDVFPTLCELTGLPIPVICDPIPSAQQFCTEGESLLPIIKGNNTYKGKTGAFSQYPRPSESTNRKSDEPRLTDIKIMGYTLKTKRYRYTEWVKFEDLTAKWDQVVGVEMYDHHIDPIESINIAGRKDLENIQIQLQKQLRLGWRTAHEIGNVKNE